MRRGRSFDFNRIGMWLRCFALVVLAGMAPIEAASAETLEDVIAAVVKVKTHIAPDGRTVSGLGREREGSGIVIDAGGLVVTIGYLMVEAYAAEIVTNDRRTIPASVVGYDHETGFGLLRAVEPLKLRPMALGKSAAVKVHDLVVIASGGGADMVAPATVVGKREFAADWEYLLEDALFTAPPHPSWSGSAMISQDGKLVGVGSLIVGDANGTHDGTPGNMFVPIDRLAPVMGDLIADGRPAGPGRPWLGINTDEAHGRLTVNRVTTGGPADKAGVERGDVIVGINGETPSGLADFYRKLWSHGEAGATVSIDLLHGRGVRHLQIKSVNRLDYLKLKSSF